MLQDRSQLFAVLSACVTVSFVNSNEAADSFQFAEVQVKNEPLRCVFVLAFRHKASLCWAGLIQRCCHQKH